MKQKLTSRKFWVCVAAMLTSFSTSIAGLAIENEIITGFGIVCSVVSAGIYAFCEAWTDVNGINKNNNDTSSEE